MSFAAIEAAAKIATLHGGDETKAVHPFWKLYYGPLVAVERNKNVARAVMSCSNCLGAPHAMDQRPAPPSDFRNLALDLSPACRNSIA